MSSPKQLLNQKFGKLTVIEQMPSYKYYNKRTNRLMSRRNWLCQCQCGEKVQRSSFALTKSRQLKCKSCAYAERPQSTRRFSALERLFNLRIKTNAEKRNIDVNITPEDFIKESSKNCFYCDKIAPEVEIYKNKYAKSETIKSHGLDRKNNNLGYNKDNIVSCCKECNTMKMDQSYEEFIQQIRKILRNQEQKQVDLEKELQKEQRKVESGY